MASNHEPLPLVVIFLSEKLFIAALSGKKSVGGDEDPASCARGKLAVNGYQLKVKEMWFFRMNGDLLEFVEQAVSDNG